MAPKTHINTHLRDGASQLARNSAALRGGFVSVDERSLTDLLNFARQYARSVKYFDHTGAVPNSENGSWDAFFDFDSAAIERQLTSRNDFEPHLALYLAFIQLFQHARQQVNTFTQQHLDFYYQQVLGMQPLAGRPDEVHVVFELAKNISEQFLPAGTALDAGKGPEGHKLSYKLDNEIAVNTAAISALRSTYVTAGEPDVVHYAAIANSSDGMGGKLPADAPSWAAFGRDGEPVLPVQKTGFAAASDLLALKEGDRTVIAEMTLSVDASFNLATANTLTSGAFEVFYSGEKGWIGPNAATVSFKQSGQRVIMTVTDAGLTKNAPAVTGYDAALLGKGFNTTLPLMQVLFSKTTTGTLRKMLQKAVVHNIKLKVDVKGVTSLQLQNDMGVLDPKKAFMPFGPIPVKGASFYVGYEEVLKKNIDTFSFDVDWQGAPVSFRDHYKNYFPPAMILGYSTGGFSYVGIHAINNIVLNSSSPVKDNNYFTASISMKGRNDKLETRLFANDGTAHLQWPFRENNTPVVTSIFSDYSNLATTFNAYYPTQFSLYSNPNFSVYAGLSLNAIWQMPVFSILNPAKPVDTSKGFVRIDLNKDFFHKKYPLVYATKMRAEADEDELPAEPYTPLIKTFSFNYTASTNVVALDTNSFGAYNTRGIQFFSVDVFGVAEQHRYLKGSLQATSVNVHLLPQYEEGGAFYIGLEKAAHGQSVSCLFQLAEGSADPEADTQDVEWSILCSNEWRRLLPEEIVLDRTNHLLRSGIIQWAIPNEATADNSLMGKGAFWIRGRVKHPPGVCKVVQLHTQAVRATFMAESGTPLMNTLAAGTIAKLKEKLATIKKVNQPYSSSQGKLQESNEAFSIRVSERLRHKQRAIMAWDYEHIVLQQFPEIYKVKCLQHSAGATAFCCAQEAPGNVTLIVVPDLRNANAIHPLEPKVGKDTLVRAAGYLQQHCSFFTTVFVENPRYEKVLLECKVRFTTQGANGYYKKLLNEELVQFLSPWAFDSNIDITFGGAVRKSVLLNFIDERPYVDFVTDCRMYHLVNGQRSGDVSEIIVSDPRAILVSASQHTVTDFTLQDVCT
ncbi:hypothetical protein MKQ68_00285 [Chitinophaga horti]|uniref:Baseplate J-like protein n=1 Tax=Chitinophaga horti TaxID=2920382 RepID=A0ABY6J1J9_9BACT|nr:hypothetical protein [Chitinophaga horti]UYQ93537.1 hypothetical protein MKQ68_00285 [Chitinophaga horti]